MLHERILGPAVDETMAEVHEELAGNEEEAPQEDIDAILDSLSPDELWERGKNHHKARENALAVECFARCCERWAADRGDLDDSLGTVYLLYGQALLNLAREDGEVVVDENIPAAAAACHGDDEFIEDEPFDENRSPTKTRQKAQADETKENKAASASVSTPVASSSGKPSVKKAPLKENGEKTSDIDSDDYDDDDISVTEFDEDAPDWLKNRGKPEKKEPEDEEAKERIKKLEEEIKERSKALEDKREAAKKQAAERKAASAARRRQEEEEDDEESEEDEEGAVDNLQLAWEVLECAKKIFSKQTDSVEKLAETLDSLGEVSSESEKFDLAISDFEACLKLRLEMPGKDRQVAETYYKLGLTLGLDKQLDAAIVNFEKAHERLEKYMIKLKDGKELDQLSQSVKSEVEEITDLLPEIQAKIVDFKDARQEAKEQISKMITEAFQGRDTSEEVSTSNGSAIAGSSKDSSANGAARATDISHLVKRKRQTDEPDGDGQPPKKTSL